MFWGLVLEPSKKYTQRVDQTFHISQAALDLKSCDQEPVQLLVEYENSNFVLATLSKKANIYQVPLDLIFKTGDQVSFRTIGNGKVHLSGYHVLEDLDSMLSKGEEESDYEEEIKEIQNLKKKRKKNKANSKGNKKAKLDDTNEDDSDELNMQTKAKKKRNQNVSMTSDDDNEDDEDENDEEEEDDEGEEFYEDDSSDVEEDGLDGEEEWESDDEEMEEDSDIEDSEEEKKNSSKIQNKKTLNGVASGNKSVFHTSQSGSKTENKKQGTPGKEGKIPKSEKKAKNFNEHVTPNKKGSEDNKKIDKLQKSPKGEGSPNKKILEGGIICEDIEVGSGPIAKPGRMVNVYYVGSLATTKKQFDSVQSGPGFKFRLGKNEVIKGWDIGVNGMKVGGTRKLTIPAHLAYGAKGSPPIIPPNSTLVFTVELKGLS